jgi:hypothetical protein
MHNPQLAPNSGLKSNNTVILTTALRGRVANAMLAGGFTVWAEFCRVALTEKCYSTENALRTTDPTDFQRIYGRDLSNS